MHKTELLTLRSHVLALQKTMAQRDNAIHEKIVIIKEKETIIKEIKDTIFEKEQHILQKQSQLKESEQAADKVNKKKLHLEQDLKKAVKEIKRYM